LAKFSKAGPWRSADRVEPLYGGIREGLEAAEATGWRSHEPAFHGLLAEALALTGAIDEGLSLLAEALATAEASGARGADAELYRLRGDLLRRLPSPQWTAVEDYFRGALTVAHEQGTVGFELRAAVSLARLLGELGRRAETRDFLAPVHGRFTEGSETTDLKEAKVLLDELLEPLRRRGSGAAGQRPGDPWPGLLAAPALKNDRSGA
jgi:predicted ATPase